jgi:hypothetical protein
MLAILAESALRSLVLGSIVWVGLNLLRVRNPHVHMTSWAMVLAASLLMPLLMHWTTATITLDPWPLPTSEKLWPAEIPLSEPLIPSLPPEPGVPGVARGENEEAVNWWGLATAIYALVSAVLLLRLALGVYLTWRLVRAAKPMSEPWAAHSDVRVSDAISGPVTFGSTILLPPQCIEWDLSKRQAVLAHEGAHVANRDFYVLLLASLNRAVYWFSPFAWWQLIRLAELAEIVSDACALEVLEDRLSYAEILLDLVRSVRQAPAGLEMARASTIRARVERILAATTAPARVGWRKQIWIALAILPVAIVSAGTIAYNTRPSSTLAIGDTGDAATGVGTPQRVSFYSLDRTSIFAIFWEGDDLFGQLSGQRKLRLSLGSDGTYSYPAAAGQIALAFGDERQPPELKLSQNGRDLRATRIAEMSWQRTDVDAALLDSYLGWYELAPNRVLTVTREAGRMYVQETGRSKFEIAAQGADAFSSKQDDLIIFLRDDQAKVTQVLRRERISGARLAPRVDVVKARMIEEEFARRIAEVPDRFRGQTPLPGSKEAVLRGIEGLQRGTPNYDRMSTPLAAKIRGHAPELQSMFKALGAVESIFFRGVGPGGYDIYGLKLANGLAEVRLLLGTDGKVDDAIFRADGNDAPGGFVACSDEPGLKAHDNTTPIQLLFSNESGGEIRLYKLDSEGRRSAHGAIGENMSSPILTNVDTPWVIADASGKCLEIVLPGQRTRFLTVEGSRVGGPERAVSRRAVPLAGSEEMLRQYIEALRRGEPNYDRMTSEVATLTRQQLPFNQAILARLGDLRAVSFRGVNAFGNDIYMTHFANGTAEWRIGLVKDGIIGKIALGPHY